MAKAPFKGIAQTLQDVLNNLQKQLKEKTLALDEANKKVAALSGGKGGDFTAELDKEKQQRAKAEQAFKDAQKQIAQLKKQVAEGSSNGDGTSSEELAAEIEKRTQIGKDLAERTDELLQTNKKLLAETQARMKVESALNNAASNAGGISESEHQLEISKREQAEAALQEAEVQLQEALSNPGDSAESEAMQQEITSLQAQLSETLAQLSVEQEDQETGGAETAALQTELDEIKSTSDQLQADKANLEGQVKELESHLKVAGKQSGSVDAVKAELEEVRKSQKALQGEKTRLEAQVANLQGKQPSAAQAPAAPPPAKKAPAAPPIPPRVFTADDKEIERIRQVIAKNPKDIKSMVQMARLAFKAHRHQDAI
ncbi:MAG: hypothetical protein IH886_07780, partial [Nitrospinae bacterium]|nr:hypothetical protein [Nitrospinota bacterium]